MVFQREREESKISAKSDGFSGNLSGSTVTPPYSSSIASRTLEHLECSFEAVPFIPLIRRELVSAATPSGPTELKALSAR